MADPDSARLARLRRSHPTLADLERSARRRIPRFAYDFIQGGAGDDSGAARNRRALADVQLVPRYGVEVGKVDTSVTLFGRRYAAPVGIGPVGMDGLMWPGATRLLAEAAQRHGLPYLCGTLATETIETVCALAPDVTWFQLYPMPAEDHRLSLDLAWRAWNAGAHVLAATLDVPVRTKRPRDLRNGFTMPFRLRPRFAAQAAMAWPWMMALAKAGVPTFANIERYSGTEDPAAFVGRNVGGGFSWEALARLRDAWPRAMMVKGVLHPADAERAVRLGIDGILVSNHGGRQFDAAPAAADVLPAIAAAVGDRATVMLDSGIASGVDVLRAMALGAQGALSGRAFLLAMAGIGDLGARHMAAALMEELETACAQCGLTSPEDAPSLARRHPGAWTAQEFGPAPATDTQTEAAE
ncbi:alpha-hydroxy acid oxidase [Wenxinia marina]|uniref:L-lactate dehydrogenase (FMN-dependent) n=1 Tax=Wenxinia marina DSM 24838 TaxID=1123501 RepID=A0A0D0Q164_9RHOB|nr:alpha-hydroxy acid oxidase [Wenxinia marina]KIQ68304.1 L-lactate dehydrogenase (FMN-dependent) [Wenxinia marina DSM 24838]GGL79608.1 lactate dehydrogenase [Wenxinia marina]